MSNILLLLTVVCSLCCFVSLFRSFPLISLPASSPQPPQFVDIPLEYEDDSSDEEYCLDKEDENAEEVKKSFISAPLVNKFCSISQKGVLCDYDVMPVTLSFWSDVDIAGSSPCCARGARPRTPGHSECEEDRFDSPRQVTHRTSAFGL